MQTAFTILAGINIIILLAILSFFAWTIIAVYLEGPINKGDI